MLVTILNNSILELTRLNTSYISVVILELFLTILGNRFKLKETIILE